MWGDAKFKRLSKLSASGQALWIFLLTGSETSIIPGLFEAGRAGLAERLSWSIEDFDRCFAEIENQKMVKADFENRLVWVPNAVRYNPPASPNVVRSWSREFAVLPECELKSEAERAICAQLQCAGPSFRRAFSDNLIKRREAGSSGKASQKTLRKALPNQKQKDEQCQEKKEQEGKSALPDQAPWIADTVAKECSFHTSEVRLILTRVVEDELAAGQGPQQIRNRLIESWKSFNSNKSQLRFHWSAKTFFGEGYWRDDNSWPWDLERMRLEREARVGTYTPV